MKETVRKVMVIGSGPVVIGASAEFDCACYESLRALREEGVETILVNSNPTSLTNERGAADRVYIEPLNVDTLRRIVEKEKPDAILPVFGGKKGMEAALELYQNGFLDGTETKILSVTPDLIRCVRDRQELAEMLGGIGIPLLANSIVSGAEQALEFAQNTGYPIVIRPAYSPESAALAYCRNDEELFKAVEKYATASVLGQVLVEKSVSGWKELEFEVIRDAAGNCICISSIENIDAAGIHSGDSISMIPAQTLTEYEHLLLRSASLKIISCLQIIGGCHIHFVLKPDGSEYSVVNIEPGFCRSSALVSKATGYQIARVATKAALGYRLYEIKNEITGCTTACNEPALDYCAVKFPKWSFEHFTGVSRTLGLAMQATGETLSIGTSFEMAFMKAVRALNIGIDTPTLPKFANKTADELIQIIASTDNERIFAVYQALKKQVPVAEIADITRIDPWFLTKMKNIAETELLLANSPQEDDMKHAKELGFTDTAIKRLSGADHLPAWSPSFKMVDTCAAEFDAVKPCFYSAWDEDNEARIFSDPAAKGKKKVLVIGSGPFGVGYGAELDYCVVNCIKALKKRGFYTVLVNNNPNAVSTDISVSDRLYIEPICPEDIVNVITVERPCAVVTAYCGENRNQIDSAAESAGVPVLGGGGKTARLLAEKHLERALIEANIPFIKEKYFNATCFEAILLCDGSECLIPGFTQLIEKADIHPGDSISVTPAVSLEDSVIRAAETYCLKLAADVLPAGMFRVEMKLYDNSVFVAGISADSFYTVPYISKATGIPLIDFAAACMLGEKIADFGYGTGLMPSKGNYAVRVPVFSFDKLESADTVLDKKMKSTGEVMGIAGCFEDALLKGLTASGMRIKRSGGVLFTVCNSDKQAAVPVAERFSQLDFTIYATAGTANHLNHNYIASNAVRKLHEGSPNIIDLINSNKIVYLICSSEKDRDSISEDKAIRRRALEKQIPVFTTMDSALALTLCLSMKRSVEDIAMVDINQA